MFKRSTGTLRKSDQHLSLNCSQSTGREDFDGLQYIFTTPHQSRLILQAVCILVCLWGWPSGTVSGQTEALSAAAWKLETIEFTDGRKLYGLLEEREDGGTLFTQVVRPAGKPMYLISWTQLDPSRIESASKLSPEDHAVLVRRVETFRAHRDVQRAAEMEVDLERTGEDGPWIYRGSWFVMQSSADVPLTREAVVRLTQVFGALESLIPPRHFPSEVLTVKLCGSAAQYQREQDTLGLVIDNPAFFSPARHLLVAGSDVPALVQHYHTAQESLASSRRAYEQLGRQLDERLRELTQDLERQGVPSAQRSEIVRRTRNRSQREQTEAFTKLDSAENENRLSLESAKKRFFSRLYHEVWHAYAARHLTGTAVQGLPRWLDEGLAQVFETAQLESGELRLDAPDSVRLKALKADLASPQPLWLANVLSADGSRFLVGHADSKSTSDRFYLYSWGLALHVALLDPILSGEKLADLSDPKSRLPGIVRFEKLVGMPLQDFERLWRTSITNLSAGSSLRQPAVENTP